MYNKKTNTYEGYIYIISNNVNNKLYVGQTYTTIKSRWRQHTKEARSGKIKNQILYLAMREFGIKNFTINTIETIICTTKEELKQQLNNKETYFINKYNTLNPNGYNLTPGGYSVSCRVKKPVTAYYANGDVYKTFPSIKEAGLFLHKNKTSNIIKCCKGNAQSAFGYIWRYEGDSFDKYPVLKTQKELDKPDSKVPVDKYSINGEFLASYSSMKEAVAELKKERNSSNATCISYCCKNKVKTAYGYVWRYKGEPFDKYDVNSNRCFKKVDVYDINTFSLVGTYESIASALREFGLENKCTAHISQCCKGLRRYAYGHIWRYHGEKLDETLLKRKIKIGAAKVNQYTINGDFIATYDSVTVAEKAVGTCSNSGVRKCCKKEQTTCHGFKWYFADDENQPDKTKIIH